ncbi:MAG: BrnT family toxin [Rhizobiaceae bacterium]|nr:BrnT family toxin [Rhizobiaceae bacterium]
MNFEWDERKRIQVIRERGVDLLHAAQMFEGEVLTRIDGRQDYGETRLISLGMVGDECFVVVHTRRHGATRLITAWKGGRDERSQYQTGITRRDQKDEGKG